MREARVVVLMPAYNAENVIGRALASLQANEEPHDIVVVDDGSAQPLQGLIAAQPNLTILRTEQNVGITDALNFGLKYILQKDYDYIARLDADDEALPNRLMRQREFLDANEDVLLVGSWGRVISEDGQELFCLNHPSDHDAILKALNYNSCFLHPSLMIRSSAVREMGVYSPDYPSAEDYEYVRRIGKHGKLANIPAYLINYTSSVNGISQHRRRQQLRSRLKIQWAYRDFSNPHFYAGITQTLALRYMPDKVVTGLKQRLAAYQQRK